MPCPAKCRASLSYVFDYRMFANVVGRLSMQMVCAPCFGKRLAVGHIVKAVLLRAKAFSHGG